RLPGQRRHLVVHLPGDAIEDEDRTEVGAAAQEAGLGERLVGLDGALLEGLADGVARLVAVGVAPRPETLDELPGLLLVLDGEVGIDLLRSGEAGDGADQPARGLG